MIKVTTTKVHITWIAEKQHTKSEKKNKIYNKWPFLKPQRKFNTKDLMEQRT